ncbi:MAG: EamA family transporter [Anaerolineales bacterium]|nr:EamA family transporter [Anaerolineales bacterium]
MVFSNWACLHLFTQGIKHIPALEANLIGTLEPVLIPIWVFLFYGESMGAFALIRRIWSYSVEWF